MRRAEKEMLKILRDNSRISLTKLANELNIDVREAFEIKNSFENRIITKYSSLIDFEKLGYTIIVNFIIKAEKDDILKGFLFNHRNVNNLYRIEDGFIAEAVFKDMKEFSDFNETLDNFNLKEKKFHPVIKEIKREGFSI